ncbi:hypothetical protein [Amycolatopsis sp. RTGN1]|uniref:hypothetical protein n=1 Tax=Amycolatopsis ponsaeliensis TaxID=2992142 RepID=UPI00254C9C4E|nr:hypothetical protein [Amycolatopsis sp. RTGN1]
MSRTWKEVKADKSAADQEAGRDVEAARTAAREATQAYVLGFRLARLRESWTRSAGTSLLSAAGCAWSPISTTTMSSYRSPSGVLPTSAPDRGTPPAP